jgi:hypothetical protein
MESKERARHIALAFQRIAEANHYLVGFVGPASLSELQMAEQILIVRSNNENNNNKTIELALDLLQQEIKGYRF